MYRIGKLATALGVCLAGICEPVMAHHSFAMFDRTKTSELKGVTVAQFEWANPHVYVVVQSGQATYTLECGSPSNMSQGGWKFNTLKIGQKINVVFFPLRNGKPGGALKTAILPDGQKFEAW